MPFFTSLSALFGREELGSESKEESKTSTPVFHGRRGHRVHTVRVGPKCSFVNVTFITGGLIFFGYKYYYTSII